MNDNNETSEDFEDWSHPTPVMMKIPRHRRRANWLLLVTWLGVAAIGVAFWYGVYRIGLAFAGKP